jgi:thiol:disulfide interchange protein DsbA
MKKIALIFTFMASIMAAAFQVGAAGFEEGKHYNAIEPQATDTGDKIEILEFFWYGCPHCYSFEPYINAWKKNKPANVEFVRVPAIFRPDWEIQARTYYALSDMGKIEDVHIKIFEEIHKNRKRLFTREQMVSFLVKQGIDKDEFQKHYDSFSVESMVRKAKKKQQAFRISGVPTVVINGKYTTSGSMAGSYENLLKVMDQLIAEESK